MRRTIIVLTVLVTLLFYAAGRQANAADPLMVFCGAAFKKPVEDVKS